MVHHSEQELGDGCNPAAPRADPEVEFFLRIAPERQAVSALEVIHTRFDLDEDEFTPLDG